MLICHATYYIQWSRIVPLLKKKNAIPVCRIDCRASAVKLNLIHLIQTMEWLGKHEPPVSVMGWCLPDAVARIVPLAGRMLSSAPPGSRAASVARATLPATILFVKCNVGKVMAAVVLVSEDSLPLTPRNRGWDTTAEAGEWPISSRQHVKDKTDQYAVSCISDPFYGHKSVGIECFSCYKASNCWD
jgi:hypothetical protein